MKTTPTHIPMPTIAALAALCTLAGCASLPAAQMALPPALAATAVLPVSGLGAGRSGQFSVGDDRGSFQRGRDALSIFDTLGFDRASTRYTLNLADGRSVQAACVGRQTTVTLNTLTGQARPYTVSCQFNGASTAQLTVAAPSRIPGTRAEREGRYAAGELVLEVRSVHELQGAKLAVETPVGYVISQGGQPVGAVEMNGLTPRLWLPTAGSPLREPVLQAALAMALLWDPSAGTP